MSSYLGFHFRQELEQTGVCVFVCVRVFVHALGAAGTTHCSQVGNSPLRTLIKNLALFREGVL